MKITFLAFYFGFGVLTNLAILGPINWSSWAAWAVLLLWPALWLMIAFLVSFVVYMIVVFFAWLLGVIDNIGFVRRWSKRRMDKRIRKFLRAVRA